MKELENLPFGFIVFYMVIGSPVITTISSSVIMWFINRKKTNAETENVIAQSYFNLLQSYKEEREFIVGEMNTLRGQQITYVANITELLKANNFMRSEVDKLKQHNHDCNETNRKMQTDLIDIQKTLASNGINKPV